MATAFDCFSDIAKCESVNKLIEALNLHSSFVETKTDDKDLKVWMNEKQIYDESLYDNLSNNEHKINWMVLYVNVE